MCCVRLRNTCATLAQHGHSSACAPLRVRVQVTGPHLVLVPKSVMGNWAREFARWCPSLKVLKLQGADKEERQRLVREELLSGYVAERAARALAVRAHVRAFQPPYRARAGTGRTHARAHAYTRACFALWCVQ
ncbi:MAG: hypothetical protein EOO41_01690 [Methanobacteriota archaeon]|nr:MAG: hypothetical protein EOO41_01690 [Euryarchaeota archaeon]